MGHTQSEYTVRIKRDAEMHAVSALLSEVMPNLNRLVWSLNRLGDSSGQKRVEEARDTLNQVGAALRGIREAT